MNVKKLLKRNPILYKLGMYWNMWYYDFIYDSWLLFKVYLRKKGWLHEMKFDPIAKLKNTHEGERCFIIATGPSLTFDDLNLLKGEITFAVNSIVKILDKMNFVPDYLGIQDAGVYKKIGEQIESCTVPRIFMTDVLYKRHCKQKDKQRYILYPKYNCRHSSHGDKRPLSSGFTDDPSKVIYDGYSITYSLLQIAVFMGFKEIYLLGCDCSYDIKSGKHHFVESGFYDKTAATVGERMIYAYSVAKDYLDKYHPDVKVYNATRGGMLNVFPRKTLDQVFSAECEK